MSVSLNIGNNDIKVLQAKGRQVKKWGRLALSPGLVKDGLVLKPQVVGAAIDDLFKASGFSKNNVVASISGLSFTYRFLDLPRMRPAEMEEAVMRAARKEISLPLEELYLSWQALPGKNGEATFFVLGVPRNMVDAVEQTMHAAGISSFLMDLRPLAIARAAHQENAIVVNLEPDCFDIVFVTGGIPRVIYTVNPRSDSATLEDNIRRLADELGKAAVFYQSNSPQVPLSPAMPLLLTGDLAAEPPAGELLRSHVEYPVSNVEPLADYPSTLPVASYAAGIGLALKRVPLKTARGENSHYHDIDINILEGKYRKPAARPVPGRSLLGGAILVIAIILLVPLFLSRADISTKNADLTIELAGLNHELGLANAAAAQSALDEASIKEMTDSAAGLLAADRMALGARGEYTRDLKRLTADLPSNTFFTDIEIDSARITIMGETDSVFTVVDYATVLESEKYFRSVRIVELDERSAYVSGPAGDEIPAPSSGIIGFTILINK